MGAWQGKAEHPQATYERKVTDLAGLLRHASVSPLPAATRTATPALTTSATAKSSAYWGSPAGVHPATLTPTDLATDSCICSWSRFTCLQQQSHCSDLLFAA